MKSLKNLMLLFVITGFAVACSQPKEENKAGIAKSDFEQVVDGKQVSLYTLTNQNGLEMNVTNYGGIVVSLLVPDKNGDMVDVVTGYKTLNEYLTNPVNFFGAAIGRYGNRIGGATFTLNDKVYTLAKNNGENSLHGGEKGYWGVVWEANQVDASTLELTYLSVDGEEGYPGNLKIKIVYQLTDNNEFAIEYYATTDATTVVNLTHHSYFNLSGEGSGTINDHVMYLNSAYYTPTDAGLIPTGEIAPVAETPMDFTTPTVIGERVNADFEALTLAKGYDHNWVINKQKEGIELAAKVTSPVSNITMEVLTDQPAIQFYGGNFMDGKVSGKAGKPYNFREAFCLETQHYPDSPNKPDFPSTVLNPGEQYRHTCIYKFSVK